MTTENKSIADMVRITAENTSNFYQQIADHIEQLELTILELNQEIAKLQGEQHGSDE